jgi:hypothetical protein
MIHAVMISCGLLGSLVGVGAAILWFWSAKVGLMKVDALPPKLGEGDLALQVGDGSFHVIQTSRIASLNAWAAILTAGSVLLQTVAFILGLLPTQA